MNEMCSANDVNVSSSKRKRIDQNNALSRRKITTEQKSKLRNSIKELIVQDIYKEDNHKTNRLLQERGWDFINEFLETFEFEVPVDQTINVAGIEFVLGSITCGDFAIDDIETTGSGASSEYELSFLVNGITLTCQFDYSYKRFFGGTTTGNIDLIIGPDTFIDTTLSFTSSNFDESSPSEAFLSCNASIDIDSISFGITLLDLFVSPLLPPIIGPILGPAICEPLEALDEVLSDAVMSISDILNEFSGILTPELTDNLYPERSMNPSPDSNFLNLTTFDPIIEFVTNPIENFVESLVTDSIFGDDGTINIPLMVSLDDSIDLVEIRLVGFSDFTLDMLSIIGNYTFESSFELGRIEIEVELAIANEDSTTDTVLVKTAINDLEFNFAMLVVIETILDIQTLFSGLENIVNCISNSLFALQVAGLSLTSGSVEGIEIAGLSQAGPQQLINEIADAIFFMYNAALMNTLPIFFESIVRGAINEAIVPTFKTCLEEFSDRVVYVPLNSACWKIELFGEGVVDVDDTDIDCSNEVHTSSHNLSIFDYATENKAYFKEGDLGYSGQIEFKEDSSVSELQVEADIDDVDTKVFNIVLTFPTCTAPCS